MRPRNTTTPAPRRTPRRAPAPPPPPPAPPAPAELATPRDAQEAAARRAIEESTDAYREFYATLEQAKAAQAEGRALVALAVVADAMRALAQVESAAVRARFAALAGLAEEAWEAHALDRTPETLAAYQAARALARAEERFS